MDGIIAMIALWFIFQAVSGQKKKKERQGEQPGELPPQEGMPVPFGIRIPSLEMRTPEALEEPKEMEEAPAPVRPSQRTQALPARQEPQLLQQVAQGLQSPQNALSAVVYAEILGKPKALRRCRRF